MNMRHTGVERGQRKEGVKQFIKGTKEAVSVRGGLK